MKILSINKFRFQRIYFSFNFYSLISYDEIKDLNLKINDIIFRFYFHPRLPICFVVARMSRLIISRYGSHIQLQMYMRFDFWFLLSSLFNSHIFSCVFERNKSRTYFRSLYFYTNIFRFTFFKSSFLFQLNLIIIRA